MHYLKCVVVFVDSLSVKDKVEECLMNIKNVGNGEALNVNLRQRTKSVEEEPKSSVAERSKNEVAVGTVKRIQDSVSVAEIQSERDTKIAEIRRQINSGEYFKNRTVGDIAKVLDARLGEDVDLERLFTAQSDKE